MLGSASASAVEPSGPMALLLRGGMCWAVVDERSVFALLIGRVVAKVNPVTI